VISVKCSTRGNRNCRWEIKNLSNHLEDLGADGNFILRDVSVIGQENAVLIHMFQKRNQWRALVNAVISIRFSVKRRNLFTIFWICRQVGL